MIIPFTSASLGDSALAALHATAMQIRPNLHSGSDRHDEFARVLMLYRHNHTPAHFAELAVVCERRAAQLGLPLDLVAAYVSLAALARWRIAQPQMEETSQ